jgi:hypothetical protein
MVLASSVANAQAALQSIRIAPLAQPKVQAAQIDEATLEKARLERENRRLREENEALKKQVDDFTALGGSNVHAYCASQNTSRNTAGAETTCGGNLACEPVSGLCKTSCTSTSDCATGSCEICGNETQGICTVAATGRSG